MTYPTLGRSGRLGNQLWQIGSTVGLARLQMQEFSPQDYTPIFPMWKYFPYFSFPKTMFTSDKDKIAGAAKSRDFAWWVKPRQRGYLQDFTCLNLAKEDMKQWIQPSDRVKQSLQPLLRQYHPYEATAVHVRRGDYQKVWGGINLLSKRYYLDAWPQGKVLVFSDDIEWCKNNLPSDNVQFVTTVGNGVPPEISDFFLMSMCKAHVISNSTFSWWAAYNSSDVTYPLPWIKGIDLDVFPAEWKSIDWQ